MTYRYQTRGTCSRSVSFDMEDGRLYNVRFEGGCSGNTQGIARLAEGMLAEEAVQKLQGIRCGFKSTSCPDQLAVAIAKALEQKEGDDTRE